MTELPEAAGKDAVVRVCTTCHGAGTFLGSRMSPLEWQNEVQDMVARGAQGSSEEIRAVIDYLVKNLGRQ